MVAAIIDLYPVHLRQRYREAVVLVVCLVMFILGLSCVTQVRTTQNKSVSQGISLPPQFCFRHCIGPRHVCENLHSDDVTIKRSFHRLWLVVILTKPIRRLQKPLKKTSASWTMQTIHINQPRFQGPLSSSGQCERGCRQTNRKRSVFLRVQVTSENLGVIEVGVNFNCGP